MQRGYQWTGRKMGGITLFEKGAELFQKTFVFRQTVDDWGVESALRTCVFSVKKPFSKLSKVLKFSFKVGGPKQSEIE